MTHANNQRNTPGLKTYLGGSNITHSRYQLRTQQIQITQTEESIGGLGNFHSRYELTTHTKQIQG